MFPREVAYISGEEIRRFLVNNIEEYVAFINKFNGRKNLYNTVYSFRKIDGKRPLYDSAAVDKIFVDMDGENSYEVMLKLHKYLEHKQVLHQVNFSGRGFHLFMYNKIYGLQNPSIAITNCVYQLCKRLSLSMGSGKEADIDSHVIGDLARLHRIPNTYHLKAKRFCIQVPEEIINDFHLIKEKAKLQQPLTPKMYGKHLLDLSFYDSNVLFENKIRIDLSEDNASQLPELQKMNLAPCLTNLLLKNYLNYKERYYSILGLMISGFTEREADLILQKHLHPEKYNKGILKERQIPQIYKKGLRYDYSRNKLIQLGFCPGSCENGKMFCTGDNNDTKNM